MSTHQTGSFLDMPSKLLSARNRPLLEAFVRGDPVSVFHPVTVTLDPTLDCNTRCKGCVEDSPMAMAGRRSIEWLRLQQLIPELKAIGVRRLSYMEASRHTIRTLRIWCERLLLMACNSPSSPMVRYWGATWMS